MLRESRIAGGIAVVAGALVLGLAACGTAAGKDAPAPDARVPVRTALVLDSLVARPVIGTGTVVAKEEVQLAFKTGGIVAEVRVHEGDRVRVGEVLAALDTREIDAHVRQAESGAEKAERDLARARNLYRDSVATLEQLQNAATAADVARADLTAARFNRRYALVVAPGDGVVLRRVAEAGELVAPGQALLTVSSEAHGQVVRLGLADRDLVRLHRGDDAQVDFDALPGEGFHGRVSEIGAAADAHTGTYTVEVALDGGTRALPSGLIGRVEVRPQQPERLRLVPVEAIAEADGDTGSVYALRPDGRSVARLPVTIAFIEGDHVAVRGGLTGVARVVTDGVAYVEDGQRVQVVP
jgi:RND family efflux transporter MFP subunit